MLDFRFTHFSASRRAQEMDAARVLVIDCEGESLQWWSEADLRHAIAEHGRHPALIRALSAYGATIEREPNTDVVDCPAIHERTSSYPHGRRVPKRIRMIKTVVPELVVGVGIVLFENDMPQIAVTGMTLEAWTNSDGTVAGVFPNREMLALKAGDFTVTEWTDLP
ncbi:hypothetical protein [Noviherbaspirillum galbum]|uniref:Uncharacterized protein n=1 Tax=Noviherbaspirillum galbum TaxID=2709383 RepID=A0A6B3SH77_9BURK|nr:hypothetical protein [Noviherbaspirillum galbum]NEX60204.1 hypothetical protein [Noviherbaspirillum galbum]